MRGASLQTGASALPAMQAAARCACTLFKKTAGAISIMCKQYICWHSHARADNNACKSAQATEDDILGACVWVPQKVEALSGVKIQQVVSGSVYGRFSLSFIWIAKPSQHMAASSCTWPMAVEKRSDVFVCRCAAPLTAPLSSQQQPKAAMC